MRKFTTWVQNPVVIPQWLSWFVALLVIRHLWVPESNTVLNVIITTLEAALMLAGAVSWVWRIKRKFQWNDVVISTLSHNPQPRRFPTRKATYIDGDSGVDTSIEIPR